MLVRARARGTHVHLCLYQALAINWESSRPYTLASTDPTAPPTCYLRPPGATQGQVCPLATAWPQGKDSGKERRPWDGRGQKNDGVPPAWISLLSSNCRYTQPFPPRSRRSKRQRDCFWQTLGSGKPRGLSQTPETGQTRLRFENTVLIFLMKARSRAQLVMAVPSLIDFCRPAKDG